MFAASPLQHKGRKYYAVKSLIIFSFSLLLLTVLSTNNSNYQFVIKTKFSLISTKRREEKIDSVSALEVKCWRVFCSEVGLSSFWITKINLILHRHWLFSSKIPFFYVRQKEKDNYFTVGWYLLVHLSLILFFLRQKFCKDRKQIMIQIAFSDLPNR